MGQYRKKPVVIEAVRYDGPGAIVARSEGAAFGATPFDEVRRFCHASFAVQHVGSVTHGGPEQYAPAILTLEGVMRIGEGDWVIRGVKGEFYPCKPDIFEATYEAVVDVSDVTGVPV